MTMTLSKIAKRQPLVHCITNYVVANFTANGLLSIGASPVMADEVQEVEEMVQIADALLLNIGTINARTLEAMLIAGKMANTRGIPVVLDPVGVGATTFRKKAVQQLLEQVRFHAIRCNEGELATIAGVEWQMKGVDSGTGNFDNLEIIEDVARKWQTIVIVTGAVDTISDGEQHVRISGGHDKITQITGSGCLLSAICSAVFTLEGNPVQLLEHLLQQYKQIALDASNVEGMGSYQVKMLDQLNQYARGVEV